jgi:hypothetical protein
LEDCNRREREKEREGGKKARNREDGWTKSWKNLQESKNGETEVRQTEMDKRITRKYGELGGRGKRRGKVKGHDKTGACARDIAVT